MQTTISNEIRLSDKVDDGFTNSSNFPAFDHADYIEWNSPTKALADFLMAIGVSEPGRLSRSLINEFSSLSDLLSAPSWRLRRVAGRRLARVIRSSHRLTKAMLSERIREGPVVCRSQELIDFLQIEIGFLNHEKLVALYLDSNCRLMRIERIADGALHEIRVDYRTILGCALAIGATGMILVHNHPSGIPQPSSADLAFTARLKDLAAQLDVQLLDHLIVARGQYGSIEDYWREAQWSGEPDTSASGSSDSAS